ncbi:MAG TPA: dihydrofolate reductase family protein [Actinomycetota bacterium]|nr:dihydrofolate reductase family protein [Actinomycetota bacterium]
MADQKVILDISMSLDGYIAGPNDGPGNGLGDGGEELHEWAYDLAAFREPHGQEGGAINEDSKMLEEAMNRPGAIICGKRMFENAEGWGDNPPFHKPVFILTHENLEPLEKEGSTTFTFVSGIENALEQAKDAAAGKDVAIGGGADTVQQFIEAGLLDEMRIHIAPLILGGGVRLFDHVSPGRLEKTRVVDSELVTHITYRFVR